MFLEGESLSINKGYLIKYILKKKSYREIIMLQPTNFHKVCEDQFCTKRFLFQMLTEIKKRILHINFSNILPLVIVSDSKTKSCRTKLHHCHAQWTTLISRPETLELVSSTTSHNKSPSINLLKNTTHY